MRNLLLSLVLMMSASGLAHAAADEGPAQAGPAQPALDARAWMPMGDPSLRFNLAHPAGWSMFIDPHSHAAAHAALMNPATYTQFMQPQFWMQFANPNNLMAWMNPASYATFMNPTTYLGWMNPAPYMHFVNPAMYLQMMNPAAYTPFMNPATYLQWMNPAAYAIPMGQPAAGAATFNWFDPNAWQQMMPQPVPAGGAATAPTPDKQ